MVQWFLSLLSNRIYVLRILNNNGPVISVIPKDSSPLITRDMRETAALKKIYMLGVASAVLPL